MEIESAATTFIFLTVCSKKYHSEIFLFDNDYKNNFVFLKRTDRMTAIIACVLFTLFGGCIWNFLFYSIYSVSIENETIKACLGLFHVPTYKRAMVCFLVTYPG